MGTVVGSWRLNLILILIIFSTLVYTANAMFGNLGGNVDENGYFNYTETGGEGLAYNQTSEGTDKGNSFIDAIFGIGNFLTFGSIDNPWARLFFNGVMAIVWLVIGYITFTFIKEFIPFV